MLNKTHILAGMLLCSFAGATAAEPTYAELLKSFTYRNLGPFRAGAWISDIAVPETPAKAHQRMFYVGARHGGVWKTINSGTTFEPVSDAHGVSSVGALAVAPSNADVVWIGSGDASSTRSGYHGDGAYKSIDGGKTWQHVGLKDSHHISRIVIHPTSPDIVYVAAMGHLYTPNEERGVFKTADGGKTWKKILYSGDLVGAIDLVADRRDPRVIYAAMYECRRFPWRLMDGGPGSGIYKTVDAGATWKRLEGGLPAGTIGHIGLDIHRKNPDVIYAVLDNNNRRSPTAQGLIGGEVYRSDNGGGAWRKTNAESDDVSRKSGYAFNQIRVDPNNPDKIYITGSNLIASSDSGKTWAGLGRSLERPFRRAFGDFRTFWIDPEDSEHMLAGSDGGVFVSYDGGKTCDHFGAFPLGEVYAIGVDMDTPYNIYAGLQDHESWKGPSNGRSGNAGIEDWVTVGIGDGMYNEPDPNGRWLYNTQEFGRHARVDQQLHTRSIITPTRPQGQPPLRFNWTAPIRLSPHNSQIVYAGAQTLFRSLDRGDHWQEISPDLTTNDPAKISAPGGSIQHCTIVTISESPATAGVIWVGTDDGKVQVTRDGGARWMDSTAAITAAGGPADAWVTRVFASRFQAGTAYITKSRRRQDDFRPFVFRTTDFGATWTQLSAGLPESAANVIVEDPVNPELLFVGVDTGVFASFDRGDNWAPLKANMPVVPVHDLIVHPREGDLVVGTFGRGIWVTNIAPLREFNSGLLSKDAHLFAIRPFAQRQERAWGNYRLYGDRYLSTANEPNGIVMTYWLKEQTAEKASMIVADPYGALVRTINLTPKPGINRAVWDLDDDRGGAAQPGEYVVTLQIGDRKLSQKARLLSRAPEDFPRQRQFRPGEEEQ